MMKMCRACLCTTKKLFEVDEKFRSSYNLLTSLNVHLNDSLPQCFCKRCMESVQFYSAFRDRCVLSESTLQVQYMDPKQPILEEPEIVIPETEEPEIEEPEIEEPEIEEPEIEEPEIEINIKSEQDSNLEQNCQYELVNLEENADIKEEETLEMESMLDDKNPLEVENGIEIPSGRPKEPQLEAVKKAKSKRKSEQTYRYELSDIEENADIDNEESSEMESIKDEGNPSELDNGIKRRKGKRRKFLLTTVKKPKEKKLAQIAKQKKLARIAKRKKLAQIEKQKEVPEIAKTETPVIEKKIDVELPCGLCDESFIIHDDLNTHLEGHHTDERCKNCSEEFENWPKLLAHRAVHSGKSGKCCHICNKKFNVLERMEKHYIYVHFKEKVKKISCEHCQKTFISPEKYSRHLESHNVDCHVCLQIFPNRHVLKFHLRSHEPKKRHQCDQCEYTAVHATVLANHKKRRHKKFCCDTCKRWFAEKKKLIKHVCKDKSILCPVCGQHIYDSFNRHMLTHESISFKCEKCPSTFKRKHSLRLHMDIHDKNPRYECDYCGRKFYYPTGLVKHRRVHTGEKPYPCDICGKRFKGSSNLKSHLQRRHDQMLTNTKVKDRVEDQ